MLEVSLGLFCSIIYMSFSAVLFIYITKSIFIPPFDSFESLVTKTKYNVISLKGSTGSIAFKVLKAEPLIEARRTKRLIITSKIEDMHKMACFEKKKKYAIYQGEDADKVTGHIMCHLDKIGEPYAKAWVTSGIVKNFKYKRAIDLGILKLMEVGLLNILKDRWLEQNIEENHQNNGEIRSIEIQQVSLVIAVICCGAITALIILIIENIVFVYKLKQL
ncbi:uncharacterized protein LOC105424724 [Pogonomyrmex barbatus]|uniref:Uncharacterized protein LOC105424724 n=1 Tax=Pogonomyrmex barbatus TaxID=144034 RepID=A0A6I9W4K4_9HYME|nr:uncharacterized protein LOC105424724 [Pogonomyrmex barbatus]